MKLEKYISGRVRYLPPELKEQMGKYSKYIMQNSEFRDHEITPHIADKYRGDFYGLLDLIGVDEIDYHPTLLLNNLLSSDEYRGYKTTIHLYGRSVTRSVLNVLRMKKE